MSARSGMLRKKLQELESELDAVFRHPADPTAPDQSSFDDIKQRFNFLSKLLAAEIESQPQTSDQLHEIDERLAELKAAFRDRNKSRSCFFSNPDDTMSICSHCTQALLYDEGGVGSGSEPEEFPGEKFRPPEKDVREIGDRRKFFGAFGSGIVVGAFIISMAVKMLSSFDHVVEFEAFLLLPPPT